MRDLRTSAVVTALSEMSLLLRSATSSPTGSPAESETASQPDCTTQPQTQLQDTGMPAKPEGQPAQLAAGTAATKPQDSGAEASKGQSSDVDVEMSSEQEQTIAVSRRAPDRFDKFAPCLI